MGKPHRTTLHRKEMRFGAELRQRERDDRSPEEQLAVLDSRPGKSIRERARLHGIIAEAMG